MAAASDTMVHRPGRRQRLLGAIAGAERVKAVGGMGMLLVKVVRLAVVPPFSWRRDCVATMSTAIRRTIVPLLFSASSFSVGLAVVFFAAIVQRLGTLDRTGGAFQVGFSREISVWVGGMIIAGVAGSAITADLGARKIREELDALAVLGVDQVRSLVVPRVLGLAFAAPILGLITLLICHASSYLALKAVFPDGVTRAAFFESYWAFVYPADFANFVLKFFVFGLFIGVVACYKGLNARGGTEGVGRAVNEFVLIAFFGIWLFHTLSNLAFFSIFPDVLVLRG
jgi:phospholipid/cholesterol/gamma-HCH transport system permease protein